MLKLSSKISISIYVVALLSLLTWGFMIFYERDFSDKKPAASENNQPVENKNNSQIESSTPTNTNNAPEEQAADSENNEESDEDTAIESTSFLDISNEDCENNCKNFSKTEDLKYCQQTCGITPKENKEKSDCDSLSNLNKDYCLKDSAINKSDIEICSDIDDAGIKNTCLNTIAQELINNRQ